LDGIHNRISNYSIYKYLNCQIDAFIGYKTLVTFT
jgi:hypothetical protein